MAVLAGRGPNDRTTEDETDWPDEADESAFLSEATARGERMRAAPAGSAPSGGGDKLPALEDLVGQVPSAVRELLDDLFRAKFTGVRRYSGVEALAPETKAER